VPGKKTSSVRITGGSLKGHQVPVPAKARPTEGRVREALFSIWQERLDGSRLLDVFAGSGVVALEAISRGALAATCLEGDPRGVRSLEATCRRLVPRGAIEVRRLSLPGGLATFTAGREGSYDLIFADPPYRTTDHGKLLLALAPLLAADGELVLEHSARVRAPEEAGPLLLTGRRRYGETALSFYLHHPP